MALEDLLAMLLLPALLTDENLLALLALTAVELSIHDGLTDATASACVMVAMVGGQRLGRQREADAFGRLGRAIVDQRGLSAYRAKVYLDFALVNHWSHPLRTNLPILQEALESARATGNIAVASYSLNNLVALALSLGRPLPEIQRQCEEALRFIRRARFPAVEAVVISQLRLVLNLRGATAHFSTFDGDDFDEGEFVAELETNSHSNVLAICWHSVRKLQARFFSGDYEEAYAASLRARMLLWTSRSFVENVEYHLYTALTVAALCDLRPAEERPALMAELEIELERFRGWAETCPENFLHKRDLIEGEYARVRGDGLAAMRHYEAAIQAARDSSLVQNEAIAHELAARFSRTAGLAAASTGYLAEALRCYRSWGAEGKVRSLERDFPELEARRATPAGTPLESADQLDLLAVAKASQAISVELSWNRVARRLLEVALEQGGAGYGCLLVRRDNQLLVAATAGVDQSGVTTSLVDPPRPPDAGVVPATVADFVCRGPERVVLDDASAGGPFADDPYIRAHGPRSLLGLPIVSQDKVVAVLYLENKLVSGAFTPQHLVALEVIAAQAAIALATADSFAKLERENTERRRAEAFLEESRGKLQQIIDNSSAVIFVKDTEGRYLLANRAFDNLFHFARDQVKGKTDEYLPLPRESLEAFRANDRAALGAERALEIEETVVAEGVAHTFLSHKFPLHDAAGRPYAVCGIASDITGRKLFEDQLRASVSLLQATLESTFDAILVVDTEGREVQSNTRFAQTFTQTSGMRHDMPFDLGKLRRPADFHAELERLSRHPNDISFAIVEFEDGRVFESYSQPQRMDHRVVGRVWSFRDVTVRIGAERERDRLLVDERRARAAAEEAVRLRDEFLSVASHELRTPLTSLQLAIQGLLRHLGNDVSAPPRATWRCAIVRSGAWALWSACSWTCRAFRREGSSSIATWSISATSCARASNSSRRTSPGQGPCSPCAPNIP